MSYYNCEEPIKRSYEILRLVPSQEREIVFGVQKGGNKRFKVGFASTLARANEQYNKKFKKQQNQAGSVQTSLNDSQERITKYELKNK